ncbi:preprotein translocase subunit SecF [Frondihabitans sp. PAMC 28766]|uniref:protein translocase subunit SecF n=1 Tax=Frondihabitans sp. PAMC 28766 TaxID=1795630 RepID=UPI00078C5A08|nr:protein translocase subunit SecF [Frondihabitans sp. PAMC 28766]AMM20914.1 preprotein translocase subunit SecF [Frondihabitans sp. PAMC 28766]
MASFSTFGNDLYTGKRSYNIIGRRKTWYLIAAVMILIAIIVPIVRGGFQFSIDFTGGSEYQISGLKNPDQSIATNTVKSFDANSVPLVSVVGNNTVRVQANNLSTTQTDALGTKLAHAYHVSDNKVATSFIGATWGGDITGQAVRGLVVFLILAAIFMTIYFRTWKMAAAAMVSLLHDLVITAGVYGVLGVQVSPAAVIGFLTILGYSLYDTVVVFDKIRENNNEDKNGSSRTFGESVNLAVNQTLVRSINTSVVALLPVASILFIGSLLLGAGTLRDIALSLFIGILVGTYSTIFIAAPVYSQIRGHEASIKQSDAKKAKAVVAP